MQTNHQQPRKTTSESNVGLPREMESSEVNVVLNDSMNKDDASEVSVEGIEACNGNSFLRRFYPNIDVMGSIWIKGKIFLTITLIGLTFLLIYLLWFCIFRTEDRAVVSHLFHQWAKKAAFQDPKRLLDKVSFSHLFFIFSFVFALCSATICWCEGDNFFPISFLCVGLIYSDTSLHLTMELLLYMKVYRL